MEYFVRKMCNEITYDDSALSPKEVENLVYASMQKKGNFGDPIKQAKYMDQEEAWNAFKAMPVFILDFPSNNIMQVWWAQLQSVTDDELELLDERFPDREGKKDEEEESSSVAEEIGRKIEKARKAAGFTQNALAQMLGTTQQQIARYENGFRSVPVERLIEMSAVLNVTAAELLPDQR